VEGLGRSFVPSVGSGTAAYGVAIAVPPAAGGFTPQISFDYDSGGGVSELGLGWKLGGLVSIRRRVENGLPRFDDSDAFELTGSGVPSDLVEMRDGYFRTQLESGAFVRIQRAENGTEWEARSKAGVTSRFGGEGFTEQEDGRVATYLLREQLDLHGHSIRFQWDTSEGHALLERVTWNDFSPSVRQELRFVYEGRPDPYELFSSGVRKTITRRLHTAEVLLGGALVRRYTLAYGGGTHSRLEAVELVGADDATNLPTLTFEYTDEILATDAQLVVMKSPPGRSPGQLDVDLADLNGDGLPDLLVGQAGQYRAYLNHDGITWKSPESWAASPSISLSDIGAQLADLDGDGAIDLVSKSGADVFRYFPGKSLTQFGDAIAIANVPSFSFEDPELRLADMDGDRRADAVVTTPAGLAIGYNLGGNDFADTRLVGEVDPTQQLLFSDGNTQLCDVNGDRLHDLCYLRSGGLVYWLGRGRGRFEAGQSAEGVPEFDATDPWKLADLNGDGWADLVHIGVQQVEVAMALGAGLFDSTIAITGTPEKGREVVVELADMNGSGTTDIVWVDVTAGPDDSWRYLELFPEGRAGLLSRIDNGLGKVTRIFYEPAAQAAARARDTANPWTERMNVAMPVVQRMEVDGSLGDALLVSRYDYRDGTWDPLDRTFAGFASGIETAVGDESTPSLVTETFFDTGIELRVLRGAVLLTEKRDEHGHVFSRTQSTYTPLDVGTSADGSALQYAYKSSERTEHVEGNEGATRSTLTEWLQDSFGNVVEERRWGKVSGDDRLIGDDEALAIRTYANNEADWIIGQLATDELTNAAGSRISLRHSYYDGKAFEGLSLGQVSRGDLMRVSSWIAGDEMVDEERYEYDEHGNQLTILNLRGGRQEYDYDDQSHTYLRAERRYVRDGKALEWLTEYDPRFGGLVSLRGPSGEKHEFAYDALGRLESVIKPGDSVELPTTRYTYELGKPHSRVTTEQRLTSGDERPMVTVSLVDGLGRARGSFAQAEGSRWVLDDFLTFDARGLASFKAFATFEAEVALRANEPREGTRTLRDALGRPVSVQHADGASTRTSYGPLQRSTWDENDNDPKSRHHDTPTTYETDGLDRVRAIVEREGPAEHRTHFDFNAAGSLLRVEDAAGSVRRYAYDGRSRRVFVDDPNAGKWTFVYTTANDLEQRIDPTGRSVRYAYDPVGRVTDEWHRFGSDEDERRMAHYRYDDASPEHPELDRNLAGNLSWVEDEVGKVFFGYDARGREVTRIRRFEDDSERAVGVVFDAADRRVERVYPDGSFLAQTYNERGLLSKLGPIVTEATWTAEGNLASASLGNGVVETHAYDARRRLQRLTALAVDGTSVRDLRYELDGASRITDVTDLRTNITPEESHTASYEFDDRYRLREVVDPVGITSFGYDDVGKITSVKSDHPDAHLNVENTYSENGAGPDQLTYHGDEAFAYDAAGRVVSDGARQLDWDAKGRLTRVERGSVVEEYNYGFDDARVIKRTTERGNAKEVRYFAKDVEERDGQLVRYVHLGSERIARLDAIDGDSTSATSPPVQTPKLDEDRAPPWLRLLGLCSGAAALAGFLMHRLGRSSLAVSSLGRTLALGLVALVLISACEGSEQAKPGRKGEITQLPAGAAFYFANGQQTPLALTNAKSGTISTSSYFPYGALKSSSGSARDPHQFVGNEVDEGAGLGDFGARPYRADLGVFLAPDPLPLFSPEEALSDPARFFAYAYAGGDPINRADPTGKTFGEYLSGLWDGAKEEGKATLSAAVSHAKGQLSALAQGRIGDYLATEAQVAIAVITAPIELAKNVASFGDAFAAAAFAKNDYEAGRLAHKPILTAMSLTAAVMGPRAGAKSPAKSATNCPCFSADTLVETCDGLRPIADIKVGDLVLSRDPETSAEACQPVLTVFITPNKELLDVQLQSATSDSTETLQATPGHPFWVEGVGWTEAADLVTGSTLSTATGEGTLVTGGLSNAIPQTVYNLEVAEFHTYFVGEQRAWVHNVCGCGGGGAGARGTGRGANNLKRAEGAEGAHSTFKRNAEGKTSGHAEWQPNSRNPSGFDQTKRVDTQHANPHTHHNRRTGQDVPTPHAHDKSTPGGVRPARPDELPQ